jgi:FkbM family methyltransferase
MNTISNNYSSINPLLDFLAIGNKNRTFEFLNILKEFYTLDPVLASEWLSTCDPNILRKQGVFLPPLFVVSKDVFKSTYYLNLNDHIGWNIYLKGFFDPVPSIFTKLLKFVGEDGVYIDGGANIGSTTIPVALAGIQCLSIEASNSTCSELLKNFSLNPSIKATAVNAALCSPSQLIKNNYSDIYRSEGNFGAGSLVLNWNTSGLNQFRELAINTTLDRLIEFYNVEKILLLKLDIEGYEYFALEGFQRGLNTFRPPVIFEWRPDLLFNSFGRADDIRVLFPEGYCFYSINYIEFKGDMKFGINLQPADFSKPVENIVALHSSFVHKELLDKLLTSYVSI